jgi:hypothetical protein
MGEQTALELLDEIAPDLANIFTSGADAASQLSSLLPEKYAPEDVVTSDGARPWELAGLCFLHARRAHEALGIFWVLYQHMLAAQTVGKRVHKGMPLIWISDCFRQLGFPVHAKRFLMLTLCEDAQQTEGVISPPTTGVYHRAVWAHGIGHDQLARYGEQLYKTAQECPEEAIFPEALLQRLDDGWITEVPSPAEAHVYRINPYYVRFHLNNLGDGTGNALELLSEYLMSCMPGCRTRRRVRSGSSDYDIICSVGVDGFDIDFRSEFGRYFVCECKDWNSSADFTTMAKFCRVLDSVKSRFGILFSKSGISGADKTKFAAREQLKVFQDRGIVITVLDQSDLEAVASGASLISLLRERYEAVRLDLLSHTS